MPNTLSEECESEKHRTQDFFRCVGCAVDEVRVSGLIFLQTRSLSSVTFSDMWSLGVASVSDVTQIDIAHVEDHSVVTPTLWGSSADQSSRHRSNWCSDSF